MSFDACLHAGPSSKPLTTHELLARACRSSRGLAAWLPSIAAQPPSAAHKDQQDGPQAAQPKAPAATDASRVRKRSRHEAPYDICPPDLAPSTSYSPPPAPASGSGGGRARGAPPPWAEPGLPPGVVLLRGYLSMDEQIRIVRQVRDLGIGPGGFYVPSYSTGGRLSLRMMCLGLHWEPRTGKYEATRSSYDGATPPPLPAWLAELCGRCLADASAAAAAAGGQRFPPLQPDICLANFYERSGRLGMHQDKDEMPDSLRAGLPVVSLSIGDAADFLYGRTRDPEQASSVRLESGDLLVFGGPGRMIFHSVARVHRDSAPRELLAATGLRPGRLNLTFRQYRAT